ncbi:MAG TPA: N-methyl-L-tryptophan oxidase [Candidatus Polarisedimenticolaceae bacterium]
MAGDFDVAIVGLGAMGSAAACHLARRGRRVLGLDRFTPPHALGSSHGETRIIREAYFEHPLYVPLVQRAYTLWTELEELAERELLRTTGGVMIGPAGGILVEGARRSAEEHGLRHELLSAREVRRRFPALSPSEAMVGVWEPRAGVLFPEACIEAHLEVARSFGATLVYGEPVIRWSPDGRGVRVVTPQGDYVAAQLLLTAGSWMRALAPEAGLPLTVTRQVLCWFAPAATPEHFAPASCPIHLWEDLPGRFFYGFPDFGTGVKLAIHHEGRATDPDHVRREVGAGEVEDLRRRFRRFMPAADGPLLRTAVCLYTNTPDEHFWIDRHPGHPQVLIASPCSGHGFKFASAIGEILADELTGKPTSFDLEPFRRR